MINLKNIFKRKTNTDHPEKRIESLKKKFGNKYKKKIISQYRRQRIKYYLERAGIDVNSQKLSEIFFHISVITTLAISLYLLYYFSITHGISWTTISVSLFVLWVFVFMLLLFAFWIIFYIVVDLRIYKRKIELEEVLPDFLQLTASNINAGMTIDRALWFAVRPRFGVLAKEIESIAKDTMGGADLKVALEKFASRYDSLILSRSISMLNEGIEAGGKIGELLNRIAIDIQEQKALLKDMYANLTTYVIFITFATIIAGPFLFAMSGVLIQVVLKLGNVLGSTSTVSGSTSIPLTFSGSGVSASDFKIFSIVSLTITSLFSAMMISTIKKGNSKEGIKYIPIFIAVSLTLYFMAQGLVGKLLSLFF